MASVIVVVLEPGGKGCGGFGVAGPDLSIGPFGFQGAVEAFDLAVLPGAVGAGEDVVGAEVGDDGA